MRLIFLGPPGSGKGTQARRLEAQLHLVQLSTGDLLRAAAKLGTEAGNTAKQFMDAGRLVPDPLVIALLVERMEQPDCSNGFILDGFPRTVPQAEALEIELKRHRATIDAVLYFEVNEEHLLERLVGRRICPNGHGEWHLRFNPPKQAGLCNVCGAPLVHREDDHKEKVTVRFEAFRRDTAPLIEFYRERGLLRTVTAQGDLEQIGTQIQQLLGLAPKRPSHAEKPTA